jgi:hypothetical protein
MLSQRYTFTAYFGSQAANPFITIGEIHQEIMGAAGILIQMAHHEDIANSTYNDSATDLLNTIGWVLAHGQTKSTLGLTNSWPGAANRLTLAQCRQSLPPVCSRKEALTMQTRWSGALI